MAKKCLVTYIDSAGEVVANEPNLLVETDDEIFTQDGKHIELSPWQFEQPGCVLLEDEVGLWSLDRTNLIDLTIVEPTA